MSGSWLLLGTNLGDRKKNLREAIRLLNLRGIEITEQSAIYESEPWGISEQPWFWNMVLEVKTSLSAHDLLTTCLSIENEMGRVRKQKWGERLIDIDILYYDDQIVNMKNLTIPHPGIPDRNFTLIPLVEKWPELVHPVLNKNQKHLLKELASSLVCKKTDVVLAHDIN